MPNITMMEMLAFGRRLSISSPSIWARSHHVLARQPGTIAGNGGFYGP